MKSFRATACLLLIVIVWKSSDSKSSISGERTSVGSSVEIGSQEYLLAQELFDNHDFALVTLNQTESASNIVMAEVRIVGARTAASNKCFLPLRPGRNVTNVGVREIKRLSNRSVLLTTYHELIGNSRPRMKLVLVDMHNCTISRPYNEFLPLSHAIFTSDKGSDQSEGRFTILMYGRDNCHGHNWCRLFFDPYYHKFETLHFDFPWKSNVNIEPATSFDGNLFVVRVNNASDAYKIRLYDVANKWASPKFKELFSMPSVKSHDIMYYYNYQLNDVKSLVKSSDLAICWTPAAATAREPTNNKTTIHCSAFDEEGNAIFNKSLLYPGALELLHVKSISNGLVLFTKKHQCKRDDCLNLYVAVITNQFYCTSENCATLYSSAMPVGDEIVQVKYRKLKVHCFYLEALKTRVNETDGSIKGEYLCDNDYRLTYHTLTIK